MTSRRNIILAGAATALTVSCATSPESALDIADDGAILDILKQRIDVEKRAPGIAVCVVTPRTQRFVSYGVARSDTGQPVTQETMFEIGSITKVFTALLLTDMARTGEVSLDDPVTNHLPSDFRVPELNGRPVTLADLAAHTSGLPRFPSFPGAPFSPDWFAAIPRFGAEDFKVWLASVTRDPIASDTGWAYSNAGYGLLAIALAHRGGASYETLLQTRVIAPLGLADTTFRPTEAMASRLAQSHHGVMISPTPPGHPPPIELGLFAAGGALRSTPRDMTRFAKALLSKSNAPIARDQALTLSVERQVTTKSPPGPLWFDGVQALAWEVRNAPGGAFVSKDGVTWGQGASMVIDRERAVAVIAFFNALPDLRSATLCGGGIGAADIAQHLLRPEIPLAGQNGTIY